MAGRIDDKDFGEPSGVSTKKSIASEVKKTFRDLVLNAKVKYIFLSYNNEGLMTIQDIKEIMSLRGKYGYFTRQHNRFKADKAANRLYKADKTVEYLHYVICQ